MKNFFFRGFDKFFAKSENGYMNVAKAVTRRSAIMLLLALGFGMILSKMDLPTLMTIREDARRASFLIQEIR